MARKNNPSRTLIIRIPEPIEREIRELCRINVMGKTEFIQIAIRLLTEYIEQYASHEMQLKLREAEAELRRLASEKAVQEAAAARAASLSPVPDSLSASPYRQGAEQVLLAAEEEAPFPCNRGGHGRGRR